MYTKGIEDINIDKGAAADASDTSLRSKEALYGVLYDKLSHNSPLTRDDLKEIQSSLRALGIDAGPVDGYAGKRTAAGIAEFLKIDENIDFVQQIGKQARHILNEFGQKETLKRLDTQAALSDEVRNISKLAIDYSLSNKELTKDNLSALQDDLNEIGYNCGKADGIMGPKTAGAIVSYMKDHPDLVMQMPVDTMRELMKHGYSKEIKALAENNNFDERIAQKLAEIGDVDRADYSQIYELQTMLAVGGYNPGGIDGVVGSLTKRAISRYSEKNNIEPANHVVTDGYKDQISHDDIEEALAKSVHEAEHTDIKSDTNRQTVETKPPLSAQPSQIAINIDSGEDKGQAEKPEEKAEDVIQAAHGIENPSVEIHPPPKPEGVADNTVDTSSNEAHTIAASTTNTGSSMEYTNGYGVSLVAIERAWANVTGDEKMPRGTMPEDSASSNPRPLVVIDPGHGCDIGSNGKIDPGSVSSQVKGLTEVAVVDKVSTSLADKLHAMGYQVAFTRNPGEPLRVSGSHDKTLRVRPEFAESLAKEMGANGVIFLSIHTNSVEDKHAHGARVYAQGSNGRVINGNSDLLADNISASYRMGNKSTKIRQADYGVLRNFEKDLGRANEVNAGVLLELGFLSSPKDAKAMKDMMQSPDAYAENIARGIERYSITQVAALRMQQQPENNQMLASSGAAKAMADLQEAAQLQQSDGDKDPQITPASFDNPMGP